jgi:hypothetical protein
MAQRQSCRLSNDLESDPVAVLLLCAGLALIAAQGWPMIQASIQ